MKHQTRLITASLSALFLLVGCQSDKVSKEEYFAKLDSVKGLTESDLIDKRGVPDQIVQAGNTKYFIYGSSWVNRRKNGSHCYRNGSMASATCEQLYCKETFKIVSNKITETKAEGNDCL